MDIVKQLLADQAAKQAALVAKGKATPQCEAVPITDEELYYLISSKIAKRGWTVPNDETLAAKWCEVVRAYYSLRRGGLFLSGPVGCGKTFLFWALDIPVINLRRAEMYSLEQLRPVLDGTLNVELLIDDIGIEGDTYSSYGKRTSLLGTIIDARSQTNAMTHFTTNLTKDELRQRYGDRTVDRIMGMTEKYIQITSAPSRRSPVNPLPPSSWMGEVYSHSDDGESWYGVKHFEWAQRQQYLKTCRHNRGECHQSKWDAREEECDSNCPVLGGCCEYCKRYWPR